MSKKNFILSISVIVVSTTSILLFIRFSNDHKECEIVTEHHLDKKGNDIVTTKHICHEENNF